MDWWKEVDDNWDNLLLLIEKFHPASHTIDDIYEDDLLPDSINYPITAPLAEKACEAVRKDIRKKENQNPCATATQAKIDRDGLRLYKIFNQTWFGMPESNAVRREAGFYTLCDLCSEYEGE